MTELNKAEAGWKFDEQVAPVFGNHVRSSVPGYDTFHDMIENLSVYFVEENSNVFDLGTSTGEAIIRVEEKNEKREGVQYIAYDNSEAMIEQARLRAVNRAGLHNHIEFCCKDLTDKSLYIEKASFITSVLTMQFVKLSEREEVLKRVHRGMLKGGAFIMVEKVLHDNTVLESIFTTEYENFKHKQGLSEEHIFTKKQSLKGVMRPLSVSDNIEMLRNAGFTTVEVFFKHMNFVGFIAIK